MRDRHSLKRDLAAYARSLGFDRVGVTSADPLSEAEASLERWVAEGKAGDMGYLERDPRRRARPADHLPGAKSVIVLAMNYYSESRAQGRFEGRISRYARGRDYHKVIQKRLESFVRYLGAMAPRAQCRTYVDTGPLLERALAQRAGLGFVGKNTLLITRGLGSWIFLASVITDLDLPADAPDRRSCGECRLCIESCPTGALSDPYHLDARRCIAYLTIELEGAIEPALRPRTAGWVFGCDICQEVCPHNSRPLVASEPAFRPDRSSALDLAEILSFSTEEAFARRFGGAPLARAERHGLLRNACLAAAHFRRLDLIPSLEKLAADSHPIVREHAVWALQALGRSD